MTLTRTVLASVSLLALAQPAWADDATDFHRTDNSDIVVTAPLHRDRLDALSGTSVLTGATLTQALRPTIGETLARTPGVSSTAFGPNASRPILRGLQGERVRLLTDGIGSIDVSNTSVDHAVVINPLLAERIEVLRGPVALLYGSAAIGGVVNVIDRRIPRQIPDEAIHVEGTATLASAARERSAGIALDAPIGGGFVAHVDGTYQKTGDLRIGGHALTRRARAEALASALLPPEEHEDEGEEGHDHGEEVDFAANAAVKGKLPNSAGKNWTAGAGLSYVDGDSHFGIAYSHYDSLYGIPVRYATLPDQEQERARIDLKQDRIDARAEIAAGGALIDKIRARLAYASYQHSEIDPEGEAHTTFQNHGYEGRLELVQADRGGWHGATGMQFVSRDFDVEGDEAALPKNRTQQLGFFTLQHYETGPIMVEGGLRYERSWLSAIPLPAQTQFYNGGHKFNALSGSLGAGYKLSEGWRIGVNLARSERAPSAEELFSNGPHPATAAFEIGDPTFKTERSWGVEGVLRGKMGSFSLEASVFHNWFTNFIYDSPDGTLEDGLPVFRNYQAKARHYGAEIEAGVDVATVGGYTVRVDGLADYVRATIVGDGPAPRIPPLRALGGIEANGDRLSARVEVEWTDRARRLATFETPTNSFTMVNATLTFKPFEASPNTSFVLSANNIFDVAGRRHTSYLKDYAPLSGRDIRLTARFSL